MYYTPPPKPTSPYWWYTNEQEKLIVIGPASDIGCGPPWHAVEECRTWRHNMFLKALEASKIKTRMGTVGATLRVRVAVPYQGEPETDL